VKIIRSTAALRLETGRWRRRGETIALVPTMGNLHAGHLALMRLARRHADRVVCSIFVNPTQFGPSEDYGRYPRTLHADERGLVSVGVDALFAPPVRAVYPRGLADATVVRLPGLSTDLCGRFRPGHFDGVTSVVARLFNLVGPDVAVFGEKDYQQLVVLRRMTQDLGFPLRIVGGRTRRERDGLALSSRNQYLTPEERALAPRLHAALRECGENIVRGERRYARLGAHGMAALRGAGFQPDYFEVRNAALETPAPGDRRLRILAAAWLGRARLIDNIAITLPAARSR
jgi:pantoate--beta-alanine ligase